MGVSAFWAFRPLLLLATWVPVAHAEEAHALREGTMEIPRRQFLHLVVGAAASSATSRTAQAQAYPTRPIRLVVSFPPGGGFDALARLWADKIRPLLGTVFIDNVGGAEFTQAT